jgi:hypothetical protein
MDGMPWIKPDFSFVKVIRCYLLRFLFKSKIGKEFFGKVGKVVFCFKFIVVVRILN